MIKERKIELEDYKTSFYLPDVITARMRLAYRGVIAKTQGDELFMLRRWEAFNRLGFIQEWESELWPDLEDDPLDSEDPKVANLIIAVVNACLMKLLDLEEITKK